MSNLRITPESEPVIIINEVIELFKRGKMDSYTDWMLKFRQDLLGSSYIEAADKIRSCYGGFGSFLDLTIGLQKDNLDAENRRFNVLRHQLYVWASKYE